MGNRNFVGYFVAFILQNVINVLHLHYENTDKEYRI